MEYEELLARAKKRMPDSVSEKERFEIPKVQGFIQGNKTIISNFIQIAERLRRSTDHLQKYVLRELGTPGDMRRGRLMLGAKVPASRINDKIKTYADEFVFCHTCGKADTDIKRETGYSFVVCSACGARRSIRTKI